MQVQKLYEYTVIMRGDQPVFVHSIGGASTHHKMALHHPKGFTRCLALVVYIAPAAKRQGAAADAVSGMEPASAQGMNSEIDNNNRLTGQTLGRAALADFLGQCTGPAVLTRCELDGEDLSRLNLRGVRFEHCTFFETTFERSDLSRTSWQSCKAGQANFHLADATEAAFTSCDLNNTSWARARLASAHFKEVKLTGAHFTGAQTLGLVFTDSLLVGADLRGVSFRKQTLERLNLSDADLAGCDFRDAIFNGGSLRNANLKNALFERADLRLVDLSGLSIATLAQSLKGSVVSMDQAASLIGSLGVQVM
jgi:uncharacterized protein YjbI with pentapeptide repeats